ncbi:hypothetical protein H4Q26_004973 [Puccinia striiformis f. sp. tritici PST-130]|nr:hypothetical protein H4Q26_004973 [Puccinia striiformis f. sp. tritici PST-130]
MPSPEVTTPVVTTYQLASLYNRTGTSSFFHNTDHVDLSIHGISTSVSPSRITPKRKQDRADGLYQETRKAAHAADSPRNAGFFGVTLTDCETVDCLDSSPSQSSFSSYSALDSCESGDDSRWLRLDDSFESFDSTWSQPDLYDIGAHLVINVENLFSGVGVSTKPSSLTIPIIESPERDTLVIYRIIGNDLPPRHSPKQTLTNLHFLLEHEDDFEEMSRHISNDSTSDSPFQASGYKLQVKKYFVLNRIANQTQLSLVQNMLKSHGVEEWQILVNPFINDAYRSQSFNSLPDIGWNSGFHSTWGVGKGPSGLAAITGVNGEQKSIETPTKSHRGNNHDRWRALDSTYHLKNLYAMNNNGGRNFALEHGRSIPEARWILPLDGNCFFTPASIHSLVISLRDSDLQSDPPFARHHSHVPLTRQQTSRTANTPIQLSKPNLEKTFRPHTKDEPQIGFRFTSNEIYSPDMRYGRRSKLELLWRLGAIERSRNLDKTTGDWEVKEKHILTSKSYGTIQRRSRSPSPISHNRVRNHFVEGRPDFIRGGQEVHSEKARSRRVVNRMKGIISFLEGIDESVARGSTSCDQSHMDASCGFADWRLWSLNGEELEKVKLQHINKDPGVAPLVAKLVQLSRNLVKYAASILSKAYLTDDEKCADMAASLVNIAFLQSPTSPIPHAFHVTLNTQLQSLRLNEDYDGLGYAFPIPRHEHALPNWVKDTTLDYLPFNPYTFDPTLLLDGIRLLWNARKNLSDKPQSAWLQESLAEKIPKQKLQDLFTLQTSYLLLNDSMVQDFFTGNSNEDLESNPSRNVFAPQDGLLDSDPSTTALILDQESSTDFSTLYQRFRTGFHNIKLQSFTNPSTTTLPNDNSGYAQESSDLLLYN